MINDGEPQGEAEHILKKAAQRIKTEEANKRVAFFTAGVENANMTRLNQISVRTPIKLKGFNFTELFLWLSAGMSAVSHSRLDEQVASPPIRWGVS